MGAVAWGWASEVRGLGGPPAADWGGGGPGMAWCGHEEGAANTTRMRDRQTHTETETERQTGGGGSMCVRPFPGRAHRKASEHRESREHTWSPGFGI